LQKGVWEHREKSCLKCGPASRSKSAAGANGRWGGSNLGKTKSQARGHSQIGEKGLDGTHLFRARRRQRRTLRNLSCSGDLGPGRTKWILHVRTNQSWESNSKIMGHLRHLKKRSRKLVNEKKLYSRGLVGGIDASGAAWVHRSASRWRINRCVKKLQRAKQNGITRQQAPRIPLSSHNNGE